MNNFTIVELDTPNKFVIYDSRGRSIFLNNTTKDQVYDMANKIFKEKDAKIQEELENEITPNNIKLFSQYKKIFTRNFIKNEKKYNNILNSYYVKYNTADVDKELNTLYNTKSVTVDDFFLKSLKIFIITKVIANKNILQLGGNDFYYGNDWYVNSEYGSIEFFSSTNISFFRKFCNFILKLLKGIIILPWFVFMAIIIIIMIYFEEGVYIDNLGSALRNQYEADYNWIIQNGGGDITKSNIIKKSILENIQKLNMKLNKQIQKLLQQIKNME
jgi:hypothetical protein